MQHDDPELNTLLERRMEAPRVDFAERIIANAAYVHRAALAPRRSWRNVVDELIGWLPVPHPVALLASVLVLGVTMGLLEPHPSAPQVVASETYFDDAGVL